MSKRKHVKQEQALPQVEVQPVVQLTCDIHGVDPGFHLKIKEDQKEELKLIGSYCMACLNQIVPQLNDFLSKNLKDYKPLTE